MNKENYKIVFAGVGGQGIITASLIIADAALKEGKNAVMSEVHGMAQRGGSVITEVKIGASSSPIVDLSMADFIVGFEPIETLRVLYKANKDTVIITDIEPIIPVSVSQGGLEYPSREKLEAEFKRVSENIHIVEALKLAELAGSTLVSNIVLVGAISSLKNFPLKQESLIESIKENLPKRFEEINLKAFEFGRKAFK